MGPAVRPESRQHASRSQGRRGFRGVGRPRSRAPVPALPSCTVTGTCGLLSGRAPTSGDRAPTGGPREDCHEQSECAHPAAASPVVCMASETPARRWHMGRLLPRLEAPESVARPDAARHRHPGHPPSRPHSDRPRTGVERPALRLPPRARPARDTAPRPRTGVRRLIPEGQDSPLRHLRRRGDRAVRRARGRRAPCKPPRSRPLSWPRPRQPDGGADVDVPGDQALAVCKDRPRNAVEEEADHR
ncbi:hypothetical protein SUDANB150_00077 [Streptomyces sp. enrichment culture]